MRFQENPLIFQYIVREKEPFERACHEDCCTYHKNWSTYFRVSRLSVMKNWIILGISESNIASENTYVFRKKMHWLTQIIWSKTCSLTMCICLGSGVSTFLIGKLVHSHCNQHHSSLKPIVIVCIFNWKGHQQVHALQSVSINAIMIAIDGMHIVTLHGAYGRFRLKMEVIIQNNGKYII